MTVCSFQPGCQPVSTGFQALSLHTPCPMYVRYLATSERVHTCKGHGRDERFSHQLCFWKGIGRMAPSLKPSLDDLISEILTAAGVDAEFFLAHEANRWTMGRLWLRWGTPRG